MVKGVKTRAKPKSDKKVMNLLLENSIALQKTLAGLAIELKSLNNKVSSLCGLFEEAGKTFEKGTAEAVGTSDMPEINDKLDNLIKQNRTIAKGLLLLEKTFKVSKPKKRITYQTEEEKGKDEAQKPEETEESGEYKPKPLPEFTF